MRQCILYKFTARWYLLFINAKQLPRKTINDSYTKAVLHFTTAEYLDYSRSDPSAV